MEKQSFNFKPRTGLLIFFGLLTLFGLILFIFELEEQDYLFQSIFILSTAGAGFGLFLKTVLKKPGLIISNEGISNNTILGAGTYFIPWEKVKTFQVKRIASKNAILIYLNNPKEILDKQNVLLKADMQSKMKKFGTPVIIMHSFLKNSASIPRILEEKLDKINPSPYKEN
jgi:hypothetical protein